MEDDELTLHDYLRVLYRRWPWIVVSVVVLVGVSLAWSLLSTKEYRANAEVLIDRQDSLDLIDPQTGQRSSDERIIETEVAFVESLSVERAVNERLGIETEVDASAAGDADVVEISAESTDPEQAAIIADTYAAVYIELRRQRAVDDYLATAQVVQDRIDEIDEELSTLDSDDPASGPLQTQRAVYVAAIESLALGADLSGGINAQVISQAEVPESPFAPQTSRNAVLAAVLGLVLGVGIVILRDTLDDSVRSKEDLETASGLPTLAVIPHVADWKRDDEERFVSLDAPSSDTAEAYRTLRTALQFFSLDRSIRTVQVTSANPGEGKTTTVVNLAVAMARAGRRVIVLDGDLRNPRVHLFFKIKRRPGFTDVLLGETTPRLAAVTPPNAGGLSILAIGAGQPTTNPSEALGGRTTRELLAMLGEAADVVLVDSPPVLPVSDALVIAGQVDAVILVAKATRARKKDLARASELLAQVNAPVLGTVLNDAPRSGGGYGYGYGSYGYPVRDEGPMKKRRNGDSGLWDDEDTESVDTLNHDLEALFPRRESAEDS